MKRAFQIAAALVMLLMAGQPVLAASTCEMGFTGSPAICPMGMSEMGSDCPMAQSMSAECYSRCTDCAAARGFMLPVVQAKPKATAAEAASFIEIEVQSAEPARPAFLPPAAAISSSPPPYILNRVFRI